MFISTNGETDMTLLELAYAKGQTDRRASFPVSANPFPKSSREAREWKAGWRDAKHVDRFIKNIGFIDPQRF